MVSLTRIAETLEQECRVWHGPQQECHRLMSAIFYKETRLTIKPKRNGTGCGVGQVLPQNRRICRRAARTRKASVRRQLLRRGWCHRPTCSQLERLKVGVHWAVRIANINRKNYCRRSQDRYRCVATFYNGSKNKKRYGKDVARLVRRYQRYRRRSELRHYTQTY